MRRRSVGFSTLIHEADRTLFNYKNFGIIDAGVRATKLDLDIPAVESSMEEERKRSTLHSFMWIAQSQDVSDLVALIRFDCPHWFEPVRRRLALNDLCWLDTRIPVNNLADFDPWSQLRGRGPWQGRDRDLLLNLGDGIWRGSSSRPRRSSTRRSGPGRRTPRPRRPGGRGRPRRRNGRRGGPGPRPQQGRLRARPWRGVHICALLWRVSWICHVFLWMRFWRRALGMAFWMLRLRSRKARDRRSRGRKEARTRARRWAPAPACAGTSDECAPCAFL